MEIGATTEMKNRRYEVAIRLTRILQPPYHFIKAIVVKPYRDGERQQICCFIL